MCTQRLKNCTKHLGGGGTQVVFKKNRLFRKTTQNIGKELKKRKELYANY